MKINSGFNNLSAVNFAAQVELIVTSLTGNANFPEPWPASVVTLAQLRTDLANHQDTLTAIAAGDRRKVPDREAQRQKLSGQLQTLALYLQAAADGDATLLSTTGFPARKETPRVQNPGPLPAPEGLLVSHSVLSGQLVVTAKKLAKAAAYDVQITAGDPTVEGNWNAAGSYTSIRRIELEGFTPGKIYWVRVRALGSAGPGAWTLATSVMAL